MDANRAEMEIESKKLRDQLNTFQVLTNDLMNSSSTLFFIQSEIESIRSKAQRLAEENESLRRELRRSVEDRLSGLNPDALLGMHNNSVVEIQNKKIALLEQEKDTAIRLYDQTAEIIARLEAENNDLKNPLKPHLMKLDMQTKQVNCYSSRLSIDPSFNQAQEEHVRAEGELIEQINIIRDELS